MATLGDKVTQTIVGAGAGAVNAVGNSIHANVKGDLAIYVAAELDKLPADHPLRPHVGDEGITSKLVDFVMSIGVYFIGILQSIWIIGEPVAEDTRAAVWASHMSRKLSVQELINAWKMGMLTDQQLDDGLRDRGYSPDKRRALYDVYSKRLGEDDIRRLALRQYVSPAMQVRGVLGGETTLPGRPFDADKALEHAGYHVDDLGLVKAAWEFLPGVQDVIRMAVKEVFSPEIAAKFQQYADLPPKFVEMAAKQGLSAEVAGWYWAAHWDLPSTTQGYEMLHRGVIKEEELDLLLRAQDVMPWWRDKLKAIAYSPLTRVDVRRMYQLGVLDEPGVVQAYKNLGYNQANADKLLEFTKVYYGPEDETGEEADRDWTKAEILDGYRKKIITTDQARLALREMSYAEAKIDFFLAREDLKAVQTRKQAYLDRWHSLYINGIAGAQDVYTNLQALGITEGEIDELLPLWNLEQVQTVTRPTKAERLKWFKSGIISQATWESELRLDGYSDAYIAMYLADSQSA
jgi:hypothetical protein